LADLAAEPYLMLTVDEAQRSAMRYWQRTPYVPNVIFRTLSIEAGRSMVATGMGITILSDMVYRPWSLEGHRIDLKTLDDDIHTMDVGLAWKSKAKLSPAAWTFCEFVALAYPGTEPVHFD
jgi:DNA-binding transcriptional LysR family regulator